MMSLVMEVTRKCSCACEHCIRGAAQNKEMDSMMVREIIGNIKPSWIHLSGGEPLLNMEATEEVLGNPYVSGVSVITSGNIPQKNTDKLVRILRGIKHLEFSIGISKDLYHPRNTRINYFEDELDLQGIPHGTHDVSRKILSLGRGSVIGWEELVEEFKYEEEATWYVTVDGDLYPTCDISYKAIRKFKKELCFGNALENSLEELEENWKRKFLGKKLILSEDFISLKTLEDTDNI